MKGLDTGKTGINFCIYTAFAAILFALLFFAQTAGSAETGQNEPDQNQLGQNQPKGEQDPMVKLETTMGDIVIELNEKKAPKSVKNFLSYVKSGHYNNTIFHRIIDNFMIQGGGFTEKMIQKPTGKPIENEADNGLKNDKYTLAMARTTDPNSATAQFFINVNDNDFLNHTGKNPQGWGYAVFGKVVEGQDVVDKIKDVPTETRGGHQDVPKEQVKIIKAEVVEK